MADEKYAMLIFVSIAFRGGVIDLRPAGLSFARWRRATSAFAHWSSDCGQAVFYF